MTIIQYTIAIFLQNNLSHIDGLFKNNGKMRSWEYLRAKLGLNDNKNSIADKLSTQILILGKKVFRVW